MKNEPICSLMSLANSLSISSSLHCATQCKCNVQHVLLNCWCGHLTDDSRIHLQVSCYRGVLLSCSHTQAIVFRPFKGEVLDAVVTQVNKVSLYLKWPEWLGM